MCADEKKRKAKDFTQWRWRSTDTRGSLKPTPLAPGARPWSRKSSLRGFPKLDRVIDVVDTSFWAAHQSRPGVPIAQLTRDLWVNVTHSVHMLPFSAGRPGTWTRNGVWYNYGRNTTLSGQGQMQLLGWCASNLAYNNLSDREFRDVSGDYFSMIVSTIFTTCCFLIPWSVIWKSD